jgi:phosphatidylglycerol:prolipoprotein diacylglycerol transferase
MLPILEIGPWHVRTSAIIYALAVLSAGAFYLRRLTGRRFQPGPTAGALVWIVAAGGLAANLGGIVNLGYELLTGDIFPAPLKSVSMPAALVGGAGAAWLICRHYHLDFWWACDQAIPALPLGQAIGQFGCLARGCCYGAPTASWLALDLPDNYGDWALRYPTHLISAAVLFAIFGVLLVAAGKQGDKETGKQGNGETGKRAGAVTLLYLALYLSFRLGIDFIRGDALPAWIGPLNTTQIACAVGLGVVALAAGRQLRTWSQKA